MSKNANGATGVSTVGDEFLCMAVRTAWSLARIMGWIYAKIQAPKSLMQEFQLTSFFSKAGQAALAAPGRGGLCGCPALRPTAHDEFLGSGLGFGRRGGSRHKPWPYAGPAVADCRDRTK